MVSEQGIVTPEAAPAADTESPTPATTDEAAPQENSAASDRTDVGSETADPAVNAATSDAGTLSATVATPIQDVDQIYELNRELRRTIINNRDRTRSGPALRYRVRLDQDGNITGYETANPAAAQATTAIDISNLVQAVDT